MSKTTRSAKLTTQVAERLCFCDHAPPGAQHVIIWDKQLTGFGLRIMASGVKAWLVQYRTADNRQRRLTIARWGKVTAQEARDRAVQIFGRVLDGGDPLAERVARREAPTVNQLVDRYLAEHVRKKNRPSTQAAVEDLVERFVRPGLGGHKVAAVTKDDLSRLHGAMSGTPRQANFMLAVCSKLFNLAERWEWRTAGAGNPCRGIERYAESERDRFLDAEELGRLGVALRLAETEGLPWKTVGRRTRFPGVVIAAVELLLFTGLRRTEALNLRWTDVNLDAGTIALPETKSGRAQIVTINAPARQVLDALRKQRGGSPWVLRSPTALNRPLPPQVLQTAWSRIRAVAGLQDVRVHDLRHTVGTHASQTGANAFAIRDLLRHQDLKMTGRYISRADAAVRNLSDAVGDRIAAGLAGTGNVVPLRKDQG
jgi:integrase